MKSFIGATLLWGLAFSIGCSDDDSPSLIDEVTEPSCSEICDRSDECVRDIDGGECGDQCDELVDNDVSADRANACADCLEERSCADSGLCWMGCISVPSMQVGTDRTY